MISTHRYIHFLLIALGFLALFLVLQFLFKSSISVFFLLFTGILFAIFIRGLSRFIFDRFPVVPEQAGITLTLLCLIAVFVAFFIFLVPQLAEQIPQLAEELSKAQNLLREKTVDFRWFENFIESDNGAVANFSQEMTSKIFGVFAGTFGLATSLFVIFFIGLSVSRHTLIFSGIFSLARVVA